MEKEGLNVAEKFGNMMQKVSSAWPGPKGGRQIINGIEYSEHALARMMPKGIQWINKAGKIIEGRGIPPSVIENAIEFGSKISSYGNAVVHLFENVKVVTDELGTFVRTVIKIGK